MLKFEFLPSISYPDWHNWQIPPLLPVTDTSYNFISHWKTNNSIISTTHQGSLILQFNEYGFFVKNDGHIGLFGRPVFGPKSWPGHFWVDFQKKIPEVSSY